MSLVSNNAKGIMLYITLMCFCNNVSGQQNYLESTKPYKAYMVSNAHFDTQWRWDVQTSINEYLKNTLCQNFHLLDTYPDYVFNFEGAVKYKWMKEYYPLEFDKVKAFAKQGRWHPSGSSWDANDFIIPSPESSFRNILLGQTFFKQELGVKSNDIFLPDCFGFPYTLPTIAAHCGIQGFSTQKLQWRNSAFNGNSKIPFSVGIWEGVDGSRIMAALDNGDYTKKYKNEDLSSRTDYIEKAKYAEYGVINQYYGTGDMGGSPSIPSVMSIEKGINGSGPLNIISAASGQLFNDFQPISKYPEFPVFKGELLMDVHGTGCYTSQAAMKLWNRKNELLADAAERTSVIAELLGSIKYPKETLNEAWSRFIWHQFHDDLTGTSIPKAYTFSWNDELLSQKQFASVLKTSVGSVIRALNTNVEGVPVVVFNTLSQTLNDIVEVEIPYESEPKVLSAYNAAGKQVPTQLISYSGKKARIVFAAIVDPLGFAVYDVRTGIGETTSVLEISNNRLENSIYKITLDKNGDIRSLIDKRCNKDLVDTGKSIRLTMFTKNESPEWPAWEILKSTLDAESIAINVSPEITIIENGPVRATLKVKRTFQGSEYVQLIRLTNGGQDDRIDIQNEVNWDTKNALLKAEFPFSFGNMQATYDLGIGNIQRGNNSPVAYEVPAQYWADLSASDSSYGVSILNDCKYGWDKPSDNTLRLTLIHTPKGEIKSEKYENEQDLGNHTFTYSIFGHVGSFNPVKTVWAAEALNQPLRTFVASKHDGELGKSVSFLHTNTPQVIVKALKKAKDGDGYVIRLYEVSGKEAKNVEVSFPYEIIEAKELNGIEEAIGNVDFKGNKLVFDCKGFQPKTFRVKLKYKQLLTPANNKCLSLDYDDKAFSPDGFRNFANFDGKTNSYAAELIPDSLTISGILFRLGKKDENNVIKCKGQKVLIPDGYRKLYVLCSSSDKDRKVIFKVDGKPYEFIVPYYSGFIGQWGHKGYSEGYLKDAEIAYVGTHRHNKKGNEAYIFTYMFKLKLELPGHAKVLELPYEPKVAVFAVTASDNEADDIQPGQSLITKPKETTSPKWFEYEPVKSNNNLLFEQEVIDHSPDFLIDQSPESAVDGDLKTRWYDSGKYSEKYIVIDLGEIKEIKRWRVVHSGKDRPDLVTSDFDFQVKADGANEWETADSVKGNIENITDRDLKIPVKSRYIRLLISKATATSRNSTSIYEFEVFKD